MTSLMAALMTSLMTSLIASLIRYACIIMDEAHERSLNTDILWVGILTTLKQSVALNPIGRSERLSTHMSVPVVCRDEMGDRRDRGGGA